MAWHRLQGDVVSIGIGPIDVDEAQYTCDLCKCALYWPGYCNACIDEYRNRNDWEVE